MAEDALSAGQGGDERGHARQSAPAREHHALEAAHVREKARSLGLPAKRQRPEREQPLGLGL
eukprot:4086500-Pyramimonas_sp.AAC.1